MLQAESIQAQLLMALNVLTEQTPDPNMECSSSQMYGMLQVLAGQE